MGKQVSNVEVYYKAISFYLKSHPQLLTDMLKVRLPAGPEALCTASCCEAVLSWQLKQQAAGAVKLRNQLICEDAKATVLKTLRCT